MAALFGADDVAELFDETRSAVRRKPHNFAFVAVVRKAQELRRRGVDKALGDRIKQAARFCAHARRFGAVERSQVLCGAGRGIENLLVQVRRRVARNADVVYVTDLDASGLEAVANCFRGKTSTVLS